MHKMIWLHCAPSLPTSAKDTSRLKRWICQSQPNKSCNTTPPTNQKERLPSNFMASNHNLPPIYPSKDVERDPYSWNKVSSYVSHEDWQTINSVAAQSGAISFIIDHAIHTTAVAIREHRLVPIIDTPRFFKWLRERTTSEPPRTSQVAT